MPHLRWVLIVRLVVAHDGGRRRRHEFQNATNVFFAGRGRHDHRVRATDDHHADAIARAGRQQAESRGGGECEVTFGDDVSVCVDVASRIDGRRQIDK